MASAAPGRQRLMRPHRAARRLALALACAAMSREVAAQETEVRQAQAARFAAMMRADVQAVAEHLGDELTYTHSGGDTETNAQFLETLRSGRGARRGSAVSAASCRQT